MLRLPSLASLLILLTLAGCVTTQKRYERALQAESRGDLFQAARAYVAVLERDADYREALAGFERTSNLAVRFEVDQAEIALQSGALEAGLQHIDRVAQLRTWATQFGTRLDVPAKAEGLERTLVDRRVSELLNQAEGEVARGRYEAAMRLFDRALGYSMPGEQRAQVDTRRAEVLLQWGTFLYERERFQEAHTVAGRVRELVVSQTLLQQAAALQADALNAGTAVVAFLPVMPVEAINRSAPSSFMTDLNDALVLDSWERTPLFIAAVRPLDVRREVRRVGRQPISRQDAILIGRVLEADLVYQPELTQFNRTEENIRTETRRARTAGRNPRDTTYTLERYTVVMQAEIQFRVLDVSSRNVLTTERVVRSASRPVVRGRYTGNPADLALSATERDYFDPRVLEQTERELQEELLQRLQAELTETTFRTILRQIR